MKTRILRNGRPSTSKPCYVTGCPALVFTAGSHKMCEACAEAALVRKRDAYRPKRRYTQRRRLEAVQESPAVIEAAFTAALAAIRQRPRDEPMLRWSSPLSRIP